MLEKYYIKLQTIDRIRAHWLGEPIERYVTWLHDRRYRPRNVFRRVRCCCTLERMRSLRSQELDRTAPTHPGIRPGLGLQSWRELSD